MSRRSQVETSGSGENDSTKSRTPARRCQSRRLVVATVLRSRSCGDRSSFPRRDRCQTESIGERPDSSHERPQPLLVKRLRSAKHKTTNVDCTRQTIGDAIIAVSALVQLANWTQQRLAELSQGGQSCPQSTQSPPAPGRASSCDWLEPTLGCPAADIATACASDAGPNCSRAGIVAAEDGGAT